MYDPTKMGLPHGTHENSSIGHHSLVKNFKAVNNLNNTTDNVFSSLKATGPSINQFMPSHVSLTSEAMLADYASSSLTNNNMPLTSY